MNRALSFFLSFIMLCALCACGQSNEQGDIPVNKEELSTESPNVVSPAPTGEKKGTRSNPYSFTDEIKLAVKNGYYDDNITEYTINLTELWESDRVAEEYPTYSLDNRLIIRGQIAVGYNSIEDEIKFGLSATYITATFNEADANIQTYEEKKLNNFLRTVYSGGTYDIIILGVDDGMSLLDISFLKIKYTDIEGNPASIWIEMPERLEEDPDTAASEPKVEVTPEELDALLLEQPMYVESTKYIIQSGRYKTLYPDMLQAVVKNNSGTDVKNTVVAFVAWDKNNFPVKIYSSGVDIHGAYIKSCSYNDVNMPDGTSYGSQSGFAIDAKESDIATFKAIVVSYDDFDGNTWENPYYDAWVELYEDKKLG